MSARVKRPRSRWRRFLGWVAKLMLVAIAWLGGLAAWIVWVGHHGQAGPHDATVEPGVAASDAAPSPVFKARIEHGLDLYRRGYAGTLIFTGGYGGSRARFAESQVARRYALRQGVPDSDILIESRSQTTYQNLLEARRLLQEHELGKVILVSDPLHMARALRLSRELGIDALASSTPTTRFRSFRTRWEFPAKEVYFFHRDLFSDRR